MRTIIAGSRTINDINELITAINNSQFGITKVISGKAKGADHLGELWAKFMDVPIEEYPADWNKHGKSAGYIRNVQMAENADALIALWDGKSRGTEHMINIAKDNNLEVYVHYINNPVDKVA